MHLWDICGLNIQEKEITQNKIAIELKINENQTDTRLIQILEKLELIFTCKKSGLYAIELNENEKLYIE